jgi:EAL domain-containing protein (putative c-di-GMP-specific phosphodiesterase class I)
MRRAIVAALVALCREIGVKLVIEGVETAEEVAVLRAAGVRFMQGFYFARPAFEALPAPETIRWPIPAAA